MKYSYAIAALGAAAVTASPVVKRAAITDADILNYALTLEHLEATFYKDGLANYTHADFIAAGFADPFYQNLMEIAADEAEHVSFLTSALSAAGATPVAACTYDFPSTDAASFVTVAQIFEGVGVSAYLGAAASIMSKTYLTAAGSILTVEARHEAYISASNKANPVPQPFDDPLLLDEVYTIVAPYITSCPASNPTLPVKAFPSLTVTTSGTITSNMTITLATEGYTLEAADGSSPIYAAFITVTGPVYTNVTAVSGGFEVVVPTGINGQSYLVLTGCSDAVNDDTVAAGPAIVEIVNPYV